MPSYAKQLIRTRLHSGVFILTFVRSLIAFAAFII